jgi:photosystem II stability/assembly factor-like uncharacterized protein
MIMKWLRLIILILISLSLVIHTFGETKSKKETKKDDTEQSKDPMSSGTFSSLKFRSVGPALMSGRISSVAINPTDNSTWYIGVASGGVWKTTNSGTTWAPIFDGEGSYSIGCVVIDPNNPLIVWVGSGENNSQRSVGYGDGVYRSDDGGKSWKNMGLKKSEHIARIIVDPRSSEIVYVASQGPLWGPGGDRGLYKSNDGGKTWKNILSFSENTGVSDLVMDPKNPDILYASSYQRRRHVWTLIDGGPDGGIHKSTDGGATWNKLTNGLPAGDVGRIGLTISPVDNRVLYAIVEAQKGKGGFFRSTDCGANWDKRSDYVAGGPQYYQTIYCDPIDVDRVYSMDVILQVSDDGGKTFTRLGEKSKHVDNHTMWINPCDTRHYIVGCDGGLYESFDRGQSWNYFANLPITQFYDVCVDNSLPFYYIYGGTQDNSTLGGPSRTRNASGITNQDWFITTGGDGFQSRVDPEDPNIVYSESQYGGLVRYDRRNGEEVGIQPQPGKGESGLRWNWDSPLIISPFSHTRLYFAANKLFRSDDRGDSWKPVSGDLTRQIDRNQLEVMGRIWSVDAVAKNASTSLYGNCVALAESPKKEGVIYVGTDDGLIHCTEDGGTIWMRYDKFPGVPERTYVSRIVASQHDVNTVYASFDNHKMADFNPYILKSVDAGKTWTSIKGNLPPNGPVLAIAEDHVNPNLLFAGTEFGVYFTVDGGQKWIQLKGGLPTIAVRDIAIQKRENDLVIASFGRGFYVLDDYTPLRTVKPEVFQQEAVAFPVKDAMMFNQAYPLGGSKKATQGEAFYTAQNPPLGAAITYYLKDSYKTKKEIRQDAEKESEKKKQPVRYPTFDELRVEDEEEAPSIFITISDAEGNIVRKLTGANSKGINRTTWDMRYPLPYLASPPPPGSDYEPESGPFVMPGKYSMTILKKVNGVLTQLAGPQMFEVFVPGQKEMKNDDFKLLVEFQEKAAKLQRAFSGASQLAGEVKNRIGSLKRALQETPAQVDNLMNDASTIDAKLAGIIRNFNGDQTLRTRNENSPPSISDRVNKATGDMSTSTSKPTQTVQDAYTIADEEFKTELQKLRTLVEVDLPNLEKAAEAAGAPWTSGRIPEWK